MPDPLPFEFCLSYLDPAAVLRSAARSRHLEQVLVFLDVWLIGGASLLMAWLAWSEGAAELGWAALAFVVALAAFVGVRVAVARWTQRLWLRWRRPDVVRPPPPAFLALIGPVERYLHDSRSAFMKVQRAKG
jgi:hypothetical protein